ncbi:DUF2141 domain-containing protein [Octadecabacter ascidiaceicola]|uniref:DUF2141 domain-containing protein n=1 Tax=Octadecabacter ascidiaceicola TaxID=1655543 RepID=A0A238JQ10_9RHOB|nr:DUF2141 domain-containing protein [Octadecabacter ascidiaceicola]SMX32768.1 hypothetical protein OCA8868_00813 [Octadecabacter ascidiaceicola]
MRTALPLLSSFIAATDLSVMAQDICTAPLNITVNGIQNGNGAVIIAAFEALDVQNAVTLTFVPAASSSVSVTLHDLPIGNYAVAAMHDENMDGDQNMDGDVPTEGYSFVAIGPSDLTPKFEDAIVAAGDDARSVLRMKYW